MNGYLLLITSQIMLGSVAAFARWANLPAEVIVLFRCGIGAIAIGGVVWYRGALKGVLGWNRTLALLCLAGVFMASNWYFFFKAVLTTTITNSILLYNLAPIFVLLSAMVFLKESPTVRQVLCIGVSFLGVVFILAAKGLSLSQIDPGCLYAIIAAVLFAQVTVLGRYLRALPAPVITLFQTSVGALLFLPVGLSHMTAPLTGTQWLVLGTMGVFHTAVPYLMYFKALQTVKAAVAGILQYVYTLSTIVFGVLFFREAVALPTLFGGLLIIASSYVALKMPGSRLFSDLFKTEPKTLNGMPAVSLCGKKGVKNA